ncbi:hypothetical protein Dimus_030506 [Dionaea muscipula]
MDEADPDFDCDPQIVHADSSLPVILGAPDLIGTGLPLDMEIHHPPSCPKLFDEPASSSEVCPFNSTLSRDLYTSDPLIPASRDPNLGILAHSDPQNDMPHLREEVHSDSASCSSGYSSLAYSRPNSRCSSSVAQCNSISGSSNVAAATNDNNLQWHAACNSKKPNISSAQVEAQQDSAACSPRSQQSAAAIQFGAQKQFSENQNSSSQPMQPIIQEAQQY